MKGAGWELINKRDSTRSDCIIWDGATNSSGYPVMRDDSGKVVLVHRHKVGASGDKPVHHTCGNKKCVNKDHLKTTSHKENILSSDGKGAKNARKTRCEHGHSLKDAYTYKDSEGRTHRQCRKCKLELVRKAASKMVRVAAHARGGTRVRSYMRSIKSGDDLVAARQQLPKANSPTEEVKRLREATGLDPEDFAAATGLHPSTVKRAEGTLQGGNPYWNLTGEHVRRIETSLGLRPHYFDDLFGTKLTRHEYGIGKRDEVEKHLPGRHDQKMHGNWASELAGGISPGKKKELIAAHSKGSKDETIGSLSKWMKNQKGSIPVLAWVGLDGEVLDIDVGTAGRASGSDDTWPRGGWADKIQRLQGVPTGPPGASPMPEEQDRIQRAFNAIFNRGTKKQRDNASALVIGGAKVLPYPSQLDHMFDRGISTVTWANNRDKKARTVDVNFDRWQPGTRDKIVKSWKGFTGWRVADKFAKEHNIDDIHEAKDQALKVKRSQGQKALPRVSSDEIETALDEALEVRANRTRAYDYLIDGEKKGRTTINPTRKTLEAYVEEFGELPSGRIFEKRHDNEEDFAELAPDEMNIEEVTKHMIGAHDQKSHGKWADKVKSMKETLGINTTHKRSEHERIKEITGTVNILRDELRKQPSLRRAMDWLDEIKNYAEEHGRDLVADQQMGVRAVEIMEDRDLKPKEKVGIAQKIKSTPTMAKEAEDFLARQKLSDKLQESRADRHRRWETTSQTAAESVERDVFEMLGGRDPKDLSLDEQLDVWNRAWNKVKEERVEEAMRS